jgi:hypothetical protein
MSTRKIPGSNAGRCVRLTTYHLHVPNVKKIRGLNLLDLPWACSGLLRDSFTLLFTLESVLRLTPKQHDIARAKSLPTLAIRVAGDTTCMLTRDIYRLIRAICLSVANFWTELWIVTVKVWESENYLRSSDSNFWTVQDVLWVPWPLHSHCAVWVLLMKDVSRTFAFSFVFSIASTTSEPHRRRIMTYLTLLNWTRCHLLLQCERRLE